MSQPFQPRTLYVLLGDPVHHSLSPALHNSAFASLKLESVYVALRAPGALVAPLMRAVARQGGGGNVTLPHKRSAVQALDRASSAVAATGACNAFWWEEGAGLCGDNTDVEGFTAAAEALLEGPLKDRRVLLVGAGGAARAVAYACLTRGVARLDLLNRSLARSESLARDLGEPTRLRLLERMEDVRSEVYDLAVNATSLGLRASDPMALDPAAIKAGAILDLVYGPDDTRLVRAARDAGLRAADGRRMLVEQAAASFRLWVGREPPRQAMAAAIGLSAFGLIRPV
ncbi:MAG: shikimate dehydrogenase [Gemmatimonadales bacterium]